MQNWEIKKTINELLTILDNNFRTKCKKIPLDDIFEMVKDIDKLLNIYQERIKECGEISINRFIPLLDLLIKIDNNEERTIEYNKILKNAYKYGARISLEHYMIYREWEEPYEEKFFQPRYNIMAGYIHFLQEIETNPNLELVIANMPSGFGKTFPEKISEAWSYGIDPTGTTLAICSNERVVKGGSNLVMEEIKSEPFGEVFPHLKYSKEDKDFFLKQTSEEWKLRDCKLLASYYTSTTQSNIVGVRASKRVHIDDLYPDYKEAMRQELNEYYLNKYKTVWRKRFVQNKKPKVVITGTLWASGDFIALVIRECKKEFKFYPHPKYKYVWVNSLDPKKITQVIIQVPALDYVTGKSVCPELKSTTELLREKLGMDEYLWETNFQQIPTDPESLFFSYTKLRTYETIPESETKIAYAVIDATRKSGKDYFAMPIMVKRKNDYMFDYYLKDCIFTREATKDMYDRIVEKIIEHHIVTLVIESNVTSELKKQIDIRLMKQGITYCKIIEKYNTSPKPVRIETEKSVIKKQMVFPKKENLGTATEMYLFMENLTLYNNAGRNPNDDAPDSLALFGSEIIEENSKPQKATPVASIRNYL